MQSQVDKRRVLAKSKRRARREPRQRVAQFAGECRRFSPPYVCSKCRSAGEKLWRQYGTFLNHIRLMCASCAIRSEGKDYVVSQDGTRATDHGHGRTDQIGWMIPAVPTEDGTFWGYTSIPQRAYEWWRELPVVDR